MGINIIKRIKNFIFNVILFIVKVVPKKKNLVLFGAWFGEKYIDNSMYLFEYMLNDDFFEIYWVTRNKTVFNKLRSENKPVVYSESLSGILKQIRAKVLVTCVDKCDFNPFFIGGTIFVNLLHGIPLKKSGFDRSPEKEEGLANYLNQLLMYNRYNIDVVISSSKLISDIFKSLWRMADEIVSLGLPRNDYFFDEALNKKVNRIKNELKIEKKAIVYMPTHRNEGKSKITISDIFDLNKIQNICEKFNYVFIIKKHYYHRNEFEDLSSFSRIFDITSEDINPQVLLYEADILVTDYSSCFFDYLLLDRPILFYCYDSDNYENNRGVYFKYEEIAAGPKCTSKDGFVRQLNTTLETNDNNYSEFRRKVRNMFFDEHNQTIVCPQISDYIKKCCISK